MPARICFLFLLLVPTGTAVRLMKKQNVVERIFQTLKSTADTLDGPAAASYQATRQGRNATAKPYIASNRYGHGTVAMKNPKNSDPPVAWIPNGVELTVLWSDRADGQCIVQWGQTVGWVKRHNIKEAGKSDGYSEATRMGRIATVQQFDIPLSMLARHTNGSQVNMENPKNQHVTWVPDGARLTVFGVEEEVHEREEVHGSDTRCIVRRGEMVGWVKTVDVAKKPKLEILVRDPRTDKWDLRVRAFYYPDTELQWDKLCEAAFCSNFYPITTGMKLGGLTFRNAEAAFQSLKYRTHPDRDTLIPEFQNANATKAFELNDGLRHRGSVWDPTYGGLGSAWKAMQAVLKAKFSKLDLKNMLLWTRDDYLLEHNSRTGKDNIWSDNEDGQGTNWLGLQLMVLRDELMGISRAEVGSWSNYIYARIDESDGAPITPKDNKVPWQNTVIAARGILVQELNRFNRFNNQRKK